MDEGTSSSAAAKRERIKAISRTVHSIPVEEGGQLRPPRPAAPTAPPAAPHWWKNAAVAAGGMAALAVGFVAGAVAFRRR
jgi:hypothetical protein